MFSHSGRSRGTARGPGGPGLPLRFDQTDARRAKKIFLTDSRDHISNHANLLEQKKAIMLQLIFLFQLVFIFPLFLAMVMYANEFETREKQKLTTTFTNRLDDEWAGCDPGYSFI